MYRRVSSSASTFGIAVLFLAHLVAAQHIETQPAVSDLRDTRFKTVTEDLTTPALGSSSLRPVQAQFSDISGHPEEYSAELVELQWRWADQIDVYVTKPAGVKKPPVTLYLYSYPSETDIFRNEAWQRAATKEGFAAVGFVTALTGQRYHQRPVTEWFVSELQESLSVSAHDIQMVLNYLAERGDLDMDRVGIAAEGSGASVAILASGVDPRIKVLDILDPWGDWPTWMAKSPFVPDEERGNFVTPEFLKKVAPLDPVDWLPKIQAKSFRLRDATFDDESPASVHAKLRSALPKGGTIATYSTHKEYMTAITDNRQMGWMYEELRMLQEPKTTTAVVTNSVASKPLPTAANDR